MKRNDIYRIASCVTLWAVICMTGAAGSDYAPPVYYEHSAMGSRFEITVYRPVEMPEETLNAAVKEAFAAIDRLEERISTWRSTSQTSHVNKNAHRMPIEVTPDVMELLTYCKALHSETGGVFDTTIGPLLEVYGFYWGQGRLPPPHALDEARAKVGMQHVLLDAERGTVKLDRSGMRLDFGGVGKGLALDEAAAVLRKHGVTVARLHGGNSTILGMDSPPGKDGWTVELTDPYNGEKPFDTVLLRNESLSSSGCDNDFEDLDGNRLCDIIDPRNGLPVADVLSVFVIAPTGMETDALGTAFVVMGAEATAAYCREHKGLRAVFVPEPNPGEPPVPQRIGFGPREDSQ